jgi:hypothetical protein
VARLRTIGFEVQRLTTSVNSNGEGENSLYAGVVNNDTTNQRSGAACISIANASSVFRINTLGGTTLGRSYYHSFYFKASTPAQGTARTIFRIATAADAAVAWFQLGTDGKIRTLNAAGAAVGIASGVLNAGQYYKLDMRIQQHTSPTTSNGIIETYIDTIQLASSSAENLNTVAFDRVDLGNNTGTAPTGTFYYDDYILNDNVGATNNSYPGFSKIILLKPVADSARGANWLTTESSSNTVNLWDAVDNTPPVGKVHTTNDAVGTKVQIYNANNNSTQNYDAAVQSYTEAGLPANAIIKSAQAIARVGQNNTTASNGGLRVVSNPADSAETTVAQVSGGAVAGTDPSGWGTRKAELVVNPTVTLGTRPVVRYGKRTGSTRAAMVDLMALQVEYDVPIEEVGSATLSADSNFPNTFGTRLRTAAIAPISESSLLAVAAGIQRPASVSLSSQSSVTAVGDVPGTVHEGSATLSSQSAQTATPAKVIASTSTISSQSALTSTPQRIQKAVSAISSQTHAIISVRPILAGLSLLSGQSSTVTLGRRVLASQHTSSAQSQITPIARRVRASGAAASGEGVVSNISASFIKQSLGALTGQSQLSSVPSRNLTGQSALSSQSAYTSAAAKITAGITALSSQTHMIISVLPIRAGLAILSGQSSVGSSSGVVKYSGSIIFSDSAVQNTTPSAYRGMSGILSGQSALSSAAFRTLAGTSLQMGGSALLSTAGKIILGTTVNLSGQSSTAGTGQRIIIAVSNISSQSHLITSVEGVLAGLAILSSQSAGTVAARRNRFALAPVTAQSLLSSDPDRIRLANHQGSGQSALEAIASIVSSDLGASLSSQSTLIVIPKLTIAGGSNLSGQTVTTGNSGVLKRGTGALAGESDFRAFISLYARAALSGETSFAAIASALSGGAAIVVGQTQIGSSAQRIRFAIIDLEGNTHMVPGSIPQLDFGSGITRLGKTSVGNRPESATLQTSQKSKIGIKPRIKVYSI